MLHVVSSHLRFYWYKLLSLLRSECWIHLKIWKHHHYPFCVVSWDDVEMMLRWCWGPAAIFKTSIWFSVSGSNFQKLTAFACSWLVSLSASNQSFHLSNWPALQLPKFTAQISISHTGIPHFRVNSSFYDATMGKRKLCSLLMWRGKQDSFECLSSWIWGELIFLVYSMSYLISRWLLIRKKESNNRRESRICSAESAVS